MLSLSVRQSKTEICANSLDPHETPCNEPSHHDMHSLHFCLLLLLLLLLLLFKELLLLLSLSLLLLLFKEKTLFASMDKPKFKNGKVYLRNSGMEGLWKKAGAPFI